MNHILDDPRSPTQQPDPPRVVDWERESVHLQCKEFGADVRYQTFLYNGRRYVSVTESRVTWFDANEGSPRDELRDEIVRDMLRDYYSDNKIVFE